MFMIFKICDGKLIKSFAEILNNPEKYVVNRKLALLISLNKNRERYCKYRNADINARFSEYMASWFQNCGFELPGNQGHFRITK